MEKNNIKKLSVTAIENGTVIDHLPAQSIFRVIKILKLEEYNNQLFFGTNLESKKYGKKAIIKIRNRYISENDMNKIALIAPTASVIEIKNYEVVKKYQVEIPDNVNKFIKCINPRCITNIQDVPTKFEIIDKENIELHCIYCEKVTKRENIDFI